ncbi:hypothetical protein Emag_007707 [Eimeria magna]
MPADTGGPTAPSSVSVPTSTQQHQHQQHQQQEQQQQHHQQQQQQQYVGLETSSLSEEKGSGVSSPGAAAVLAAALFPGGPLDPSGLRSVERCTEASCGQRKPEESLLRRLRGFTGPEPPDRLELGQSCWALLHRAAAVFPLHPVSCCCYC